MALQIKAANVAQAITKFYADHPEARRATPFFAFNGYIERGACSPFINKARKEMGLPPMKADARCRSRPQPSSSQASVRSPKIALKVRLQRHVEVLHRHRQPQVHKARHPMLADAAGHDAVEMREIRIDIDRDAVERNPVPHADADGRDLVFAFPAAPTRPPGPRAARPSR